MTSHNLLRSVGERLKSLDCSAHECDGFYHHNGTIITTMVVETDTCERCKMIGEINQYLIESGDSPLSQSEQVDY